MTLGVICTGYAVLTTGQASCINQVIAIVAGYAYVRTHQVAV